MEPASAFEAVFSKTAICNGSEFWVVTRVQPAGVLITFAVLLLLQAGMADIPTLDTPIGRIQRFYANHGGIIVVAQVISILASILLTVAAQSDANGIVSITPAGKRQLSRLREIVKQVEDEFFAPLDPEGRETFHDQLLQLVNQHDPRCGFAPTVSSKHD